MVKTAAGKSEGLLAEINGLESVADAHIVAGNYDIIAEIDAPDVYDVLQAASSQMQQLNGVTETKTYIAMG
ncbi:Transcription regulator AsnC-type-like protein [Natrinema limicola JCM 13563]|uniref:Transcription regulator AsnC-type-like protein n=2 Tax=Natrinema limicola TaxID=370323 RepID=M0CPN3_9EURY|nr:Transcription regulator AsnC-type-like protein [Natrinema limicola JCM 13563]